MKLAMRITIEFLTAAATVCFLAIVVLWVRSYFYNEELHWFGERRELSLRSNRGGFDGYRVWAKSLNSTPTKFTFFRSRAKANLDERVTVLKRDSNMSYFGPHLGFAFFRDSNPGYAELFVEVMIPWWFPALLAGGLPAIRLWRWRKRRLAQKPGCCAGCGYDMRATPGRCPECGRVPMAAAIAKDERPL